MNSNTYNRMAEMDLLKDLTGTVVIDESIPDGIIRVMQDLTVEQFVNRHERRKRAALARRAKKR